MEPGSSPSSSSSLSPSASSSSASSPSPLSSSEAGQNFAWLLSLLIGAVIAVASLATLELNSYFTWHPLLMAIGFMGFLFQGVFYFGKHPALPSTLKRNRKIDLHWITMALAALFIAGGFVAIYLSKDERSKPHFTTWHSYAGGLAVVLVLLQVLSSLPLRFSLLRNASFHYGDTVRLHRYSAVFTTLVAVLALALGVLTKWFSGTVGAYTVYLIISGLAYIAVSVGTTVASRR